MFKDKTPEQLKQEYQFTLSKISHEIRNPVTLINSYLQFIEQAHPEVDGYEYWEDLWDQMDFLKKLLDELSLYNNSGKLHLEPIHISPYLARLVSGFQPAYSYLGIRLLYEDLTKDTDPVLSLDIVKIQQTLYNLIRNACESIDGAGEVHIILKREKGFLLIQIADDGCGIDPAHLSTLFDPFVTHKKNGTGLGLAIVREIIHAHGGEVSVSSRPAKGSVFTLSFPMSG